MLLIEKNELEPLSASDPVAKCAICEKRRATWMGPKKDEGTQVPMCAWCVLYGGSAWGYKHREGILHLGIVARQTALMRARSRAGVRVPELDERHRMGAEDAERLMLGVGYTSIHLRGRLASALGALGE